MIGVALEGGGAKGSFQVGAMKAMYEMGILPDVVVGTSIGAINGAFIAAGELKLLESLWRSTEIEDMMNDDAEQIRKLLSFNLKNDTSGVGEFLIETLRKGGLDVAPLKEKLRLYLDESKLRASAMDFGLVTLALTDLTPLEVYLEDIPEGQLHDYVMASASFPAFRLDKINDKTMIDGCFFDNLPINLLLKKGCDRILAVRIFGRGRLRKLDNPNLVPIEFIIPSEDLGHTLGVDSERAAHNIELGYYDAMRVLKRLKSKRYYVEAVPSETEMVAQLNTLSVEAIGVAEQFLKKGKMPKRLLFEDVLPILADLLGLKKYASYVEIVLSFYEYMAEALSVKRLQFYDYNAFVDAVHVAYEAYPEKKVDGWGSGVASLLTKKYKNQQLFQLFNVLHYDRTHML
ncbi:patatin-like phospholipase family protein [Fusibacter sp. JL298sf-3]